MEIDCIPHKATGFFSGLNIDYLEQKERLHPFYKFTPDDQGLDEAIRVRAQFPVDRKALVSILRKQYEGYTLPPILDQHIDSLQEDSTFTVCTAHQPNLLTGYLYFIYKIIHAVKLASHLQNRHPEKKFVPVFYIGSEDNDLEELGVFRYNGTRFRWQTHQTGAVGRMTTADLRPLLRELLAQLGPPGIPADQLKEMILAAYESQPDMAAATRYIVHALLGRYGVVVINPDDRELKKLFVPLLKAELLQPLAHELVREPSEILNQHYKAQAFARPINLFYLKDNQRERIEQTGNGWKVLHSSQHWDKEALLTEIEQHPERFSPNVILRGLFQESILPNVAFIGGGSEVAYWLQLMPLFDHYQVFFPALVLRQSVLWMEKNAVALQEKTGLNNEALFQPTEQLVRDFVHRHTQNDLRLNDIRQQLQPVMEQLKAKATSVDRTLKASTEAALVKMRYQVEVIEKKMMRAEKKNMCNRLTQLYTLKKQLFPNNSLQERYETFMPYFLEYGPAYFDTLLAATLPYGNSFLIIKDK